MSNFCYRSPAHAKRNQALQNYWSKRNDILEEMNKSRDHDYKKYPRWLHNALLQLEQPRVPYKINQDNILSHLVTFTVVTAMLFIVSAFVGGAIFSGRAVAELYGFDPVDRSGVDDIPQKFYQPNRAAQQPTQQSAKKPSNSQPTQTASITATTL